LDLSSLDDEWDALPHTTNFRVPVTASTPYFFRWKINQLKLMLNDLKDLRDKHQVESASQLYDLLMEEADMLCEQLFAIIDEKRKWRESLSE